MERTGRTGAEAKACGGIAGIIGKFDLDVLPSTAQFEKKTGYQDVRDLQDLFYARRFDWNASLASKNFSDQPSPGSLAPRVRLHRELKYLLVQRGEESGETCPLLGINDFRTVE